MEEMTRRNFVGTGSLALAGMALAGLAGCSPTAQTPSENGDATDVDAKQTAETDMAATGDLTYADRVSGAERFAIAPVAKSEAGTPIASVDLLVVGGGNAGLFAAAHGASLGMSVMLVDKNSVTGGAGTGTEVAMGFSECKYAQGTENFAADREELFHYFMMHNYWESNGMLVAKYFARNSDMHDFLYDNDVPMMMVLPYGVLDAPAGGLMYEGQGSGVCSNLLRIAQENGADIRTSTPAIRLVTENGAVAGAMVDAGSGEEYVEAKAVFVATGGFGTNPDMVHFYLGKTGDIASKRDEQMGIPHDGDGICMMLGVGAVEADTMDTSAPAACAVADVLWESEIDRAGREPYLWVNNAGKRLTNEKWIAMDITYKVAEKEPSHTYWNIFDQAAVNRMETEPFMTGSRTVLGSNDPMPNMGKELDKGVESGILYKADTLEELAQLCGIDAAALVATAERYNDHCKKGLDPDFYKPTEYLIEISQPPYYAIEEVPAWYATLNGVVINENFEVLDKSEKPIPGLFAGGADSSQFFNITYNHGFGGSDSAFSYVSGFCAAEAAQEYVNA